MLANVESLPRFIVTLDAAGLAALPDAPAATDEPGTETPPRVRIPLALTGQWVRGERRFEITLADLEAIVRNFRARRNGEINVDYDHASEMPEVAAGGPIPSAGRILALDPPEVLGAGDSGLGDRAPSTQPLAPSPRYVLYGWFEPTERACDLIRRREYRYISPAIDWGARSKESGRPQGATLSSVALTNRPFLEELPPIRLSDPEYRLVADVIATGTDSPNGETRNSKLDNRASNFEFRFSNFDFQNAGGPMTQTQFAVQDGRVRITQDGREIIAEAEDIRRCGEALGLIPPASAAGDSGAAISLSQARALMSEAQARGRSLPAEEFFRGEVERELDDAVRQGKVLPRQRDDWRRIALSDLATFRRLIAGQKPQVPLEPAGFAGAAPENVQAEVRLLAERRMKERGLTFGQALTELGRERPELVREYRRAVSGGE